ncbi:MAG TPA: tRNA adenosine(34) deaminase TadA [Elusimicrobiota bacterium]|nr:tRNA adenosine(34) deaminase TadA [Elusimicrobiota bacterium]
MQLPRKKTPPVKSDEKYMRLAMAEARLAGRGGDVPVGAVLVRNGLVVAKGRNRMRKDLDPSAHAEMVAIRRAAHLLKNERLEGTILYTTMEPCPMCSGTLVLARVERVVYGTRDFKAGACGTVMDLSRHPSLNHRFDVTGGVMEKECRLLLQRFFKARR